MVVVGWLCLVVEVGGLEIVGVVVVVGVGVWDVFGRIGVCRCALGVVGVFGSVHV